MTVIRFGVQIPSFSFEGVPAAGLLDRLAALAGSAEGAGFDSLFVMDHFYQIGTVGSPEEPMLEGYTTLAAIAARSKSLQLGTMVTGVTYRNPALLAKTLTTLDVLSGGRAILGIGAAWNEQEHAGYGFDFPPVAERFGRLEEAVRICRAMFTEERPSFAGRYYRIEGALNNPRPLRGDIPILIGGSGEQKTLRLVAQYADACNLFGGPDTLRHKLGVLAGHCEAVGRDPGEITKTCLCTMVIDEDGARAHATARQIAARRGLDEDAASQVAVFGDPGQVAEQVGERLAAGLDGIVFNFLPPPRPETLALAGEALQRL